MCRVDNLTTFMCRLSWNLGASASWNPQGLSRPVIGLLYLLLNNIQFLRAIRHIGLPRKEELCNLLFMKPELLKKSAHYALLVSSDTLTNVLWFEYYRHLHPLQIRSVTSLYLWKGTCKQTHAYFCVYIAYSATNSYTFWVLAFTTDA